MLQELREATETGRGSESWLVYLNAYKALSIVIDDTQEYGITIYQYMTDEEGVFHFDAQETVSIDDWYRTLPDLLSEWDGEDTSGIDIPSDQDGIHCLSISGIVIVMHPNDEFKYVDVDRWFVLGNDAVVSYDLRQAKSLRQVLDELQKYALGGYFNVTQSD